MENVTFAWMSKNLFKTFILIFTISSQSFDSFYNYFYLFDVMKMMHTA